MGAKLKKRKTPIDRGAPAGEVVWGDESKSNRRVHRAARLWRASANHLAECNFVTTEKLKAHTCRGVYPRYYVTEFVQRVQGKHERSCKLVAARICDDCRNALLLAQTIRRRREGLIDDGADASAAEFAAELQKLLAEGVPFYQARERATEKIEGRRSPYVVAIAELLGELEGLGLLSRLRESLRAKPALF